MRFVSVLLLLTSLLFSASPEITTTMSIQELDKLTASDGADGDYFGSSVAISGDTAIVGANSANDSGAKIGSAYIYERDSDTGLFQQTVKLTASDGADGDRFGHSVAISGDTVVVGAYGNDASGSAYIYEKPDSGWIDATQTAKLTASDGASDDRFGNSVAISGDTVVIGAWFADLFGEGSDSGSAYIYEKPSSGWVNATQTAKLTATYEGSLSTRFGSCVAISGDTVVVGAYGYDSSAGDDSGSAYIYEKPGTGWVNATQTAKLTASDADQNDLFGFRLAISGDTVVVGVYRDDDLGSYSGSVYIYEKPGTGWVNATQTAKLTASDGAYLDYFGYGVDISGDTIFVGAPYDDDDAGSIYLYEKPSTGWADSNQESVKLTAPDGADNGWFGSSVAISGDTILVGAPNDDAAVSNSGSAYIFKNAITQNSIENKKDIIDIEASDADDNYPITFSLLGGSDVSFFDIDASTGLLSFKVAPDFENPQDTDANNIYEATINLTDDSGESNTYAVYIRVSDVAYEGPMPKAISFKELNKFTASDGSTDDNFGISTAISGTTLVVGAYGYEENTGRVYIYEYNALSDHFEEVAKLRASDHAVNDNFGYSVAISGDTVVVGAHLNDDAGSTYIYEKPGSGWTDSNQTAKLTASDGASDDWFGYSVAISGDMVVVGASRDDNSDTDSGSAYIYEKPDSGWTDSNQTAKLTASDGAAYDYLGRSVTMSGDTVVVGAYADDNSDPGSGSAYIYEKPSSGWVNATQTAKLTASDGAAYDYFGISVAISGDTVVVGAYNDDDSGSAYIYEKPGTGWTDHNQTAKLTASDGADSDYFGYSVAISGDTVVVGAYRDDDSGSAYIYEKSGSGWIDATQTAKLTASDGADSDYFGYSVAISGDTIAVGAYLDDTDTLGDESGSAYVFKAKPSVVNPAIIMYLLN